MFDGSSNPEQTETPSTSLSLYDRLRSNKQPAEALLALAAPVVVRGFDVFLRLSFPLLAVFPCRLNTDDRTVQGHRKMNQGQNDRPSDGRRAEGW